MATTRTLHALLIGIDTYESVRPLAGCIQDVRSVEDFLKTQKEFNLSLKILTSDGSEKPTKANIVKAFSTHFEAVQPGDVILFYFAGHGVRERTNVPAFLRVEPDGCLATLVCYDTQARSGHKGEGSTLSDKELRYLLYKYTAPKNAHVVFITDCCHSGGNSRNLEGGQPITGEQVDVQELTSRLATPQALPERPYEGFIFSNEISLQTLSNDQVILDEFFPEADHIHMAACRNVEEAWEARRDDGSIGGYFTITILDILKKISAGLSYYELRKRATSIMRDMKRKPQTPQIYASNKNPNEIYSTFLKGTPGKRPAYCTVTYNQATGWTIDLGAIHGIPVNTEEDPTPVKVIAEDESTYLARVIRVFPGYCQIEYDGNTPEKTGFYKGWVEGVAYLPINVFLAGKKEAIDNFKKKYEEKNPEGENPAISLIDTEELADYVLRGEQDQMIITYPFDSKPLVEQIFGYQPISMELAYNYLLHISRWNFIHQLHHPKTRLHDNPPHGIEMYPVEVQIFQLQPDHSEKELKLETEQVEIDFNMKDNFNHPITKMRIKITNHHSQPLYCSLIYMSMTFASFPTLLPTRGMWLNTGESAEAADGNYITVKHSKYINDFDWDHSKDFIKLVMSTSEFDPMIMYLSDLPHPLISPNRGTETRTLLVPDPQNTPPREDWSTKLITLFTNRTAT